MRPWTLVVMLLLTALPTAAQNPADEIRKGFEAFVAAQNAHDAKALEPLLLDSDQFLWITRGAAIWGSPEALRRFEALYKGTWHLEPDYAAFRVVFTRGDAAQLFVPVRFTLGPAGQPPQEAQFLLNQTLVRTEGRWRVASILPIPVPPPAGPATGK